MMQGSSSPRRSLSAQQRYSMLSNRSVSESFASQEDETEVDTRAGESLFSTSAEFEDDEGYESSESRDWYGAVKKTLYQGTVRLLQGLEDWDDGSTDFEDYSTSRLDEDSRANTAQGDGVSSFGVESSALQFQPQQLNQWTNRPSLLEHSTVATPASEREETGYLSFRRRGTPLKTEDVSHHRRLTATPHHPLRRLRSPPRQRSLSPLKRSVSGFPSLSPGKDSIISPTRSRSLGTRGPRRHLQFSHQDRRGYVERAVISGGTESRSDDTMDFPNSPLLAPSAANFSSSSSRSRRTNYKRPAYIDTQIRRTKNGEISWDTIPGKRTLAGAAGPNEANVAKRRKERSAYRMEAIGDTTSPYPSLMTSHHHIRNNTPALADMTSPQSTFGSKSFQTLSERDKDHLRHMHSHTVTNKPRRLDDDKAPSYHEFGANYPRQEENEIVFDEEEDMHTSRPEDSLWEDGSAWKIDNFDDQFNMLVRGSAMKRESSARDKIKNLFRRANCTSGASAGLILDKLGSDKVFSPLTEEDSDTPTDFQQLSDSSEETQPSKVESPKQSHSSEETQQSNVESPKQNIGVLQHFKNARCSYPKFDESKLRAIVESSNRTERTKLKGLDVSRNSERKPRYGADKQMFRKGKGFKGQLAALGQRASCAPIIPAVDSMKAETPRAPDCSFKESFDGDSPSQSSDTRRPRPQLNEHNIHISQKSAPQKTKLCAEPRTEINTKPLFDSPTFLSPLYGNNTGKVEWFVVKPVVQEDAHLTKDAGLQKPDNPVTPQNGREDCFLPMPDAPTKYHTLYGDEVAEFRERQQKSLALVEQKSRLASDLKVECSTPDETKHPVPSTTSPFQGAIQSITRRHSLRKPTVATDTQLTTPIPDDMPRIEKWIQEDRSRLTSDLKVECSTPAEMAHHVSQTTSPFKRAIQSITRRHSLRKSIVATDTKLATSIPDKIPGIEDWVQEDQKHPLVVDTGHPSFHLEKIDSGINDEPHSDDSAPLKIESSKPLVSALRKGSKRRHLKTVNSKDAELETANQSRSRRVMFSEQVEEAFIDSRYYHNEVFTPEPRLWPAEELVKVFGTCGVGSSVGDSCDDGDPEDAESISPVAEHVTRIEVYNTPDDFEDFYSHDEVPDQLASPASVSKPLLCREKPREENCPRKASQRADDSLLKPDVEERFRLFRRKKERKLFSQADATPGDKDKGQYENLDDQAAPSQKRWTSTLERSLLRSKSNRMATTRHQNATYNNLEEQGPSPTAGDGDIMLSEQKNVSRNETTEKVRRTQKQKKGKGARKARHSDVANNKATSDESIREKKRHLRLRVFKTRSEKPLEDDETQNKKDLTSHNPVTAPIHPVGAPTKSRESNKSSRRQGSRPVTKLVNFKKLKPIPEEDSTQGSLSDTCLLEEIKPIKCETKSSFRIKNFFRRKKKTEGQSEAKPTLYARRQKERAQRLHEKKRRSEEEGQSKDLKESRLSGRHVYGKIDFKNSDQKHSTLPPVLIVEAETRRSKKHQEDEVKELPDTMMDSPVDSNRTEGTRLRRIEKSLSRHLMEDLLVLAKLEREQRRLVASGANASSLSQMMVDDIVSRLENKVKASHRHRSTTSRCFESEQRESRLSDSLGCTPCTRSVI